MLSLSQQEIVEQTRSFVEKRLTGFEGSHDYWHSYRVWQLAKTIAETEPVCGFVVQLGALLHDIADAKFHNGDYEVASRVAGGFLARQGVKKAEREHVQQIVRHVSFKGEAHRQSFRSPELEVVQDADRLEALGAIGIARTFAYGGFRQHPIYVPGQAPRRKMNNEQYRNHQSHTINHFYEKLLLLKDRMNTPTGKNMAAHRHKVMENFLDEFFREWRGEC